MSALWVHLDPLDGPGRVTLPADEARHVVARRLRSGDALVVFDGRGHTADARVVGLSRRSVELEVDAPGAVAEDASGLVLATAVPKGERLPTMLGMLVQLGVDAWQPLICEQSVVRRLDPEAPRLRRLVLESCKVARRARAMGLHAPGSVASVLESRAGAGRVAFGDRGGEVGPVAFGDRGGEAGRLAVGDRGGEAGRLAFGDREAEAGGEAASGAGLFLVGPEAGFTEDERARLRGAGARPIRLAPFNLRIETAAVAAAAWWLGGRMLAGVGMGRGPNLDPERAQ